MESSIKALAGKAVGTQGLTHDEMVEIAQETRRRRDAIETGGTSSTFEDGGTCNREFSDPTQKYVLVNVASTNQRPKSLKPAFRVMGIFETVLELQQHAQMVASMDNSCDMRMWTSQEFYNISLDHDADLQLQMHKVNNNLRLHQERLNADTEEFVKHKEEITQGRTPVNMQADSLEDAEQRIAKNKEAAARATDEVGEGVVETKSDDGGEGVVETKSDGETDDGGEGVEETSSPDSTVPFFSSQATTDDNSENWEEEVLKAWPNSTPVCKAPRLAEVRNQNWISFMMVHDYQDGTEPGICVLGAFDTEENAHKYNKYVAAQKIDEHELHTHAMYEWIYPHLIESETFNNVEQLYRNDEQDRIMRTMRKQRQDVANFEKHFEQRGMNIPTIEVEQDLLEAPTSTQPTQSDTQPPTQSES